MSVIAPTHVCQMPPNGALHKNKKLYLLDETKGCVRIVGKVKIKIENNPWE